MSGVRMVVLLASIFFLLAAPSRASSLGEKAGKIKNATTQVARTVHEQQSFDPIHHRRDLGMLISALGLLAAGIKGIFFVHNYRRNRKNAVAYTAPPPANTASPPPRLY